MKIFKLKCIAVVMMTGLLVSCTATDNLPEADKVATEASNGFVLPEKINHYIIDGKLKYDRKEIANAAQDAWNVEIDFVKNKMTISTTSKEYDKYVNANPELKAEMLKLKDIKSVDESEFAVSKPIETSNLTGRVAAEIDYNNYYVVNHNNLLTLGVHQLNPSETLSDDFKYWTFSMNANSNTSLQQNVWKATHAQLNSGILLLKSAPPKTLFEYARGISNNAELSNHSDKIYDVYLYKQANYGGTSVKLVIPSNYSERIGGLLCYYNGTSYVGYPSYKAIKRT